MFNNVGKKIKGFAKFMFVLNLISWIVITIALFILYDSVSYKIEAYFLGMAISSLILGPISAVLTSYLLYGFGELIENTAKAAANNTTNSPTPSNDLPEL